MKTRGVLKAALFALLAAGVILVMVLMTSLVAAPYATGVSIRVDVRTPDTSEWNDPNPDTLPELTDANGVAIPGTSTGPSPGMCRGLCTFDWQGYQWTSTDLAGHPEPFTLTLVDDGEQVSSMTATTWTRYLGDYEDGTHTLSRWKSLPSAWYQTANGATTLIIVGCLAILKTLEYAALGLRSLPRWLAIGIGNALILPYLWSSTMGLSGGTLAMVMMTIASGWDTAWIVTAPERRHRRRWVTVVVAILVLLIGFGIGLSIGSSAGVIEWGIMY